MKITNESPSPYVWGELYWQTKNSAKQRLELYCIKIHKWTKSLDMLPRKQKQTLAT